MATVGGVSWVGHGDGEEPGSCMNVPTKIEKIKMCVCLHVQQTALA